MLQGKTNSEVLKSIQTQLSRFLYPQTAREAQQKVNFTKKLLNVYTYSSENGLFLIVFRICLIQQLISVSDIFPGFCFCRCCCFCSTKQNPTWERERVTPYFSFVPSQLESTFSGHKPKLCSESSISTRICVNVVWMFLHQAL